MEYYVESTALFAFLSGKKENRKNVLVKNVFEIEQGGLEGLFDELIGSFNGFYDSVMEIDQKKSKRFQAVGIEDCRYEQLANGNYVYRFIFRYILREQRKLWLTNKDNKQSRTVEYKGAEFQSIVVCASYYLSGSKLLIDRRGTLGPLCSFFEQTFSFLLDPAEYGLDTQEELEKGLKIRIKQDLSDDFEEKINEHFKSINKLSFGFAKPSETRAKNLKKSDTNVPDFIKKGVERMFGAGAVGNNFMDLPIKTFSISIKLDDKYDARELKSFKKSAKDNILEQAKAEYVSSGLVEFEEDEAGAEIEKAILRGVAQTERRDLDVDSYDNSDVFFSWHDEIVER